MNGKPDDLIATPSQTVGPFFHIGLTAQQATEGAADSSNRLVRLRIRVLDGDGLPVPDALLEISCASRLGRLPTGEDGCCEFEVERPASHVAVCLFARGLLRHLHTRVYFPGDTPLAGDGALALVPEARRKTLLARRDENESERWLFDVRLQGDGETVFFDL